MWEYKRMRVRAPYGDLLCRDGLEWALWTLANRLASPRVTGLVITAQQLSCVGELRAAEPGDQPRTRHLVGHHASRRTDARPPSGLCDITLLQDRTLHAVAAGRTPRADESVGVLWLEPGRIGDLLDRAWVAAGCPTDCATTLRVVRAARPDPHGTDARLVVEYRHVGPGSTTPMRRITADLVGRIVAVA